MAYTILLVDTESGSRARRAAVLVAAGYLVTTASSFQEALYRLSFERPDLVVTDVRLGEYNGLHLVMRSRREQPGIGALVTDDAPDRMLVTEASRLGAICLEREAAPDVLLEAAWRALSNRHTQTAHEISKRRWPRWEPDRLVEVLVDQVAGEIADLGLGGACVVLTRLPQMSEAGLLRLVIPEAGLRIATVLVWGRIETGSHRWRGGLAVAERERRIGEAWASFVKSLQPTAC